MLRSGPGSGPGSTTPLGAAGVAWLHAGAAQPHARLAAATKMMCMHQLLLIIAAAKHLSALQCACCHHRCTLDVAAAAARGEGGGLWELAGAHFQAGQYKEGQGVVGWVVDAAGTSQCVCLVSPAVDTTALMWRAESAAGGLAPRVCATQANECAPCCKKLRMLMCGV